MQREYELTKDSFDDTIPIRKMSELTKTEGADWFLRTTAYSLHCISVDMTFVPGIEARLFEPLVQ